MSLAPPIHFVGSNFEGLSFVLDFSDNSEASKHWRRVVNTACADQPLLRRSRGPSISRRLDRHPLLEFKAP